MSEREKFRRHAMFGIPVPGFFPSNPDQLLLNDALYERVNHGVELPSWYANVYENPGEFDGAHRGVLRRLLNLSTPDRSSEEDDNRRTWATYKAWCFDSSGELFAEDERIPRERLNEYFSQEEI